MKRLLIPILSLLLSSFVVNAQTVADALRFSQFGIGGTARTVAIGGAIGAFGADFSTVSTNPAGLGSYTGSEFTMTPSLYLSNVDASLRGGANSTVGDSKTNFNFNNIGIVFGKKLDTDRSQWRTSNYSIGINRLANFNEQISYSGDSPGSYIDFFQDVSTGLFPQDFNDFDNGLAWDVGAIYDLEEDGFYETDVELADGAPISKSQTIERSGSINEVVFSVAGLKGDKFQIGATLGIPIASYSEFNVYSEDDNDVDNVPFFKDMTYTQDLTTTGYGINLKLGVIYRVSQTLRVGGAIHSPTRIRLSDDFQTRLVYDFDDGVESGPLEAASPESTFDYDIRTPWRFLANGGLLIKRKGFISAEIEFLNYGGATFKEPDLPDGTSVNTGFFNDLNQDVSNTLTSAILFRVGGEYVVDKLRFRAGLNLSTSPYADESGIDKIYYSAGVGYRAKKFFIDGAYRILVEDSVFSPYSVGNTNPQLVNLSGNTNSLLLTLGFRF